MPSKVQKKIDNSKRKRDFKVRHKGRVERRLKSKNKEDTKYVQAYKRPNL